MNVAIYARKSTEQSRVAEDAKSVTRQVELARLYAERKGWELAHIVVDIRYDVEEDGHAVFDRTITVPSELDPDRRQRLAEIAERTPVTLALRTGTPIPTRFLSGDAP